MHIFIWHQGWFYLLFIISVVKFEVDLISYLCGQKSFWKKREGIKKQKKKKEATL